MNKEVSEGNLINDVFKVEGVQKGAAGTRFLDPEPRKVENLGSGPTRTRLSADPGPGLGMPTAPY